MAITKHNLEPAIHLLQALAQRHDEVLRMAQALATNAVWRTPDGLLAAELTPQNCQDLEAFISQYLQESEAAIALLWLAIGSPPK